MNIVWLKISWLRNSHKFIQFSQNLTFTQLLPGLQIIPKLEQNRTSLLKENYGIWTPNTLSCTSDLEKNRSSLLKENNGFWSPNNLSCTTYLVNSLWKIIILILFFKIFSPGTSLCTVLIKISINYLYTILLSQVKRYYILITLTWVKVDLNIM